MTTTKTLDLYDLLNSDELESITSKLLEAASRKGYNFSAFTPILKIEGELS